MKKSILTIAMLALGLSANAQVSYDIIPQPQSVELAEKGGSFALTQGSTVSYSAKDDEKMQKNAQFLCDYLQEAVGLKLNAQADAKRAAITLSLGLKNENPEAYTLSVTKKGITIQGASPAGVFYGIQTLRKIVGVEPAETLQLPYATINDAPRFGYRGVHLDVSRHFFPVEFIKEFIDILALHGCNNLHWHLTDDQGWRFEVKALPELAKKGSIRKQTVIGHNLNIYDEQEYGRGMYYTQEQCRELVKYAAERNINIIPEIDLPGHMVAALHVMPELGCTGGPYDVWCIWGVSADVLCAGNPKVMEFLKTVLSEVADVFPSPYIHIGGDESPRDRWKTCPKCQAKMKELGLKHEAELQTYINKELETFLAAKGRRLIGWDETLEGGLSENALVMSWRGNAGGIQAARQKHQVIMTPNGECYFDYYQLKGRHDQPMGIGGYLPVSRVYQLEPQPNELTEEEKPYIIGVQCNLWTEYVVSSEQVEFMLLPRLSAMSEVQWTPAEKKDLENFKQRLPRMLKLYDKLGYKYCPKAE